MDLLEEKGFIPEEFIESETTWFYNSLGIDGMFARQEGSALTVALTVAQICTLSTRRRKRSRITFSRYTPERLRRLHERTIVSLFASTGSTKVTWIPPLHKPPGQILTAHLDHAVYIDTSTPGVSVLQGPQYEQRMDEKYLNVSNPEKAYRVETFRSPSPLNGSDTDERLRCYFVYQCDFVNPTPDKEETDLAVVSDKIFLQKVTPNTKKIYQDIVTAVIERRTGPVIKVFELENTPEKRLVIGYKQGSTMGLFSALSDLYHYYGCTSARKYVEQFSNGVTVMSMYLRPVPGSQARQARHPPIADSIQQIMKEVSLLYCIPQNKFQHHFIRGQLSLQETMYAHCVSLFVSHFLNRLGSEYAELSKLLDNNNSSHAEILSTMKRRLRQETFTAEYIYDVINDHPDLIGSLYLSFANTHYVQAKGENDNFLPTLSYQRIRMGRIMTKAELKEKIDSSVANENQQKIMYQFITFNSHVLKTNFYTPTKMALSFRMSPAFLPDGEYPQPLFGMFMVVGSEFRGFHLRFRDIARGGIRLVHSRNKEHWSMNARSVFDENYNLANTQQRKNKDIPEGGSKGVILLDPEHQDKPKVAFQKYIDSILDLLLPPRSPGIKDPIVDLHAQPEILFMGPDEGTAGLVDWATEHAKARGAPWWKSYFTGKSTKLGGIPHDEYGMTTLSVREYINGIYRKLNIDPSKVRKLQTGGPDGDLGSNEILLSNEMYIAIGMFFLFFSFLFLFLRWSPYF